MGTPLDPDCVTALQEDATLCADLGHAVTEAVPVFNAERLFQAYATLVASGFAWAIEDWGRRTGRTPTAEAFEPFVWALAEKGRQIPAPAYLLALQALQREARSLARFFVEHDVWLTPTLGEPPVPLGTFAFSAEDPFAMRRQPFCVSHAVNGNPLPLKPVMSLPGVLR